MLCSLLVAIYLYTFMILLLFCFTAMLLPLLEEKNRTFCRFQSSAILCLLSHVITYYGGCIFKQATLIVLFWLGLSRLTTDEKFKDAFSPFGNIVEAKIVTDRATGRSKGFGFVRYMTIEEAEKAREGMNAKFLDGWVIFVDPAKPRESRPPPPRSEPESSETGYRTNKTVGWCG